MSPRAATPRALKIRYTCWITSDGLMYRSMRGATKRSERVFCVYERCLVIKKSPWSFGRYVLNFSSISFIPFDVSPAERGVDGCNGGQPVVALAYRPCAGARSFLAPMAWLFASCMRLLDP